MRNKEEEERTGGRVQMNSGGGKEFHLLYDPLYALHASHASDENSFLCCDNRF